MLSAVAPAFALGHAHILLCDEREAISELAFCVLRDALSRALLRMRGCVHAITNRPHPEERPSAASRRTHHADANPPRCVNPLPTCGGGRGKGLNTKCAHALVLSGIAGMRLPSHL